MSIGCFVIWQKKEAKKAENAIIEHSHLGLRCANGSLSFIHRILNKTIPITVGVGFYIIVSTMDIEQGLFKINNFLRLKAHAFYCSYISKCETVHNCVFSFIL